MRGQGTHRVKASKDAFYIALHDRLDTSRDNPRDSPHDYSLAKSAERASVEVRRMSRLRR